MVLFVARPALAWLSLSGAGCPGGERAIISFFGIRGLGSVYYLAYASGKTEFEGIRTVWATVLLIILISIFVHGIAVTPSMSWLDRKLRPRLGPGSTCREAFSRRDQGRSHRAIDFNNGMIDLLKTKHPLILAAKTSERDLEPIDHLRTRYFPPDRNFLRAHLTMFYRLPGEHLDEVVRNITEVAKDAGPIEAKVSGLRHLGAGVAFTIDSLELQNVRARLKSAFTPWLGSQDMQKWQPHITIQNKVTKTAADSLYGLLHENFVPSSIKIDGVDLWRYLGGPWQIENSARFASPVARNNSG